MSNNARTLVSRTAGARKSQGEYKPIVVSTFARKALWTDDLVHTKETEVIGTDYLGVNVDGSLKSGKFGMYRGTTFATKAEAIAHADAYLVDLAAREAEDAARRQRVAGGGSGTGERKMSACLRAMAS